MLVSSTHIQIVIYANQSIRFGEQFSSREDAVCYVISHSEKMYYRKGVLSILWRLKFFILILYFTRILVTCYLTPYYSYQLLLVHKTWEQSSNCQMVSFILQSRWQVCSAALLQSHRVIPVIFSKLVLITPQEG